MKKFILLLPLLLFKVYGTESAMNSAMNNKELKNAGVSAALNTGIALLKGESVDDAIKTGALATVSQQLKKFIVDYQNTLKNKSNAANLKELQDTAALIHAALLAIKDQYNIPSETLTALQKIQKGGAVNSEEILVSLNAFFEELAQGNITGTLKANKVKITAIEKENLKIGQIMIDLVIKNVDKKNKSKMAQLSLFLPKKSDLKDFTKFENNVKKIKEISKGQETFIKKTLGENKPQNNSANNFINAAIM